MGNDPIRGRTVRWTYSDGPVKGRTFEHTFRDDGTVSYRGVDGQGAGGTAAADEPAVPYQVARVNGDVYAVSYLASSGFTLTSVLDLRSGTVVSFASNEKQLFLQQGTFTFV